MKLRLLFVAFLFLSVVNKTFAQPCTATGIITVGPAGNYPTLTAVADALRADGPSGNVIIELEAGYTSAAETFPISFAGISCLNAANPVTIRPQASATGLTITTASQYTFSLANTQYITIDGRPGGTGEAIELTISNTNDKGAAVWFINSASHNTLTYLNIRGSASNNLPVAVNNYDTTAVINFSASTTGNGCDSNLISHCNVFEADPTGNIFPATIIHAAGAATRVNNHNTIADCNLYNFYQPSANSAGINLEEYNSDWSITGNSLYQTEPGGYILATYTPSVYFIKIKSTQFNDFVVEGNYIGGSGPRATGAQMEMGGNMIFYGISVANAYIPGHPSFVRNNVLKNFTVSVSNNGGWCDAIVLSNFFGHCTGNMIGDTATAESIRFYGSGSSAQFIGISTTINNFVQPDTIKGNIISGVMYYTSNGSFIGINAGGSGNMIIDSNYVGYPSMPNSILNSGGGSLYGIRLVNYSSSGKLFVRRNSFSNFTSSSGLSTSGAVAGIYSEGNASGRYVIEDNTIFNLKSANITLSATTASVCGLLLNIGGTPAIRISNNRIYSLSTTNSPSSSFGTYIHGIYYNGPATGADTIQANIITGISSTASGTQNFQGIQLQAGNSLVCNNVVRLGLDDLGNSVNQGFNFTGINETGGVNRILHNSVYIGGTNTSSVAANSTAFNSALTSGTRVVANNIFYNARSSGTGKNYDITLAGTAPDANLFLDNNIYYTTGSNSFVGRFSSTDFTTLSSWRTALQKDANTAFIDPSFVAINNPLSSMDYHLNGSNPAEAAGTAIHTVSTDIDNEIRTSLTPVDIGADAGLYVRNNAPVQPVITSFIPAAAPAGTPVTIAGTGFTGVSAVSFGNIPAVSFTVVNDSTITAVTGEGNSGFVKVINIAGTAQLAGFTYLPVCTWTGLVNEVWENAGNWSCGFVPNSNTIVIINSGIVVLHANATIWSLSLAPGVSLTVTAPYNLTVIH